MTAVWSELSEDLSQKSKYAKWRAAYIIKCVKSNEKPLPPEDETKSKSNEELNNLTNTQNDQSNEQNDNQSNYDGGNTNIIGKPPAAPSFDDFNNLTINNKPSSNISSRPSTATYPSINQPTSSLSNPNDNSDDSLAAINGIRITQDDIQKAQKFNKWAQSALDYSDIKTAVTNLQKALNILTKGRED